MVLLKGEFVEQPGRVQSVNGVPNIHSLLALSGMAGPFILFLADLLPSFSQPGYDFARNSISSLALTPLGWVQTIGFLAIGLLVEIFTAGLFFNIRGESLFALSIALLACFGFGLLLIGAFRVDPAGSLPTIEGKIHLWTASVVFWLFPASILFLLPSLRSDPYWRKIFPYSVFSIAFALFLAIGRIFLPAELSWFGLYERIIVANAVIWVEVAAIHLFILSIRRQREARRNNSVTSQTV